MKILLWSIFVLSTIEVEAKTYYFSSSMGDDSRTNIEAQNSKTPWKTLNKLNLIFDSLKPGDSILLRKGDVFYGRIIINKSGTFSNPIVVSAYGTGVKPCISGFTTLMKWTNMGNGKYKSYCASCKTSDNVLTINGIVEGIGRYPNSGYLSYESFSGGNSITDNSLKESPNWTGAEVVIKKYRWFIEASDIIKHSGNTLTYSPSYWNGSKGWGYFIQNSSKTLDSFGEWFFDSTTKNMQVYFGANNPNSYNVKNSVVDTLVYIKASNYIVLDNLSLIGASRFTCYSFWSSYNYIQNCDIDYSGGDAITGFWSNSLTIKNNTINNSNEIGINLDGICNYVTIENNKIKNTSLIKGMCRRKGEDPNETSIAIRVSESSNVSIKYNEIDSTGYEGISFKTGNHIIIKNNFINHSCITKDDGAGIYCVSNISSANSSNRQIVDNIVLNSIGNIEGVGESKLLQAQGIYIDGYARNVDILNNTVSGCSSYGIFLNTDKNFNINVRGNTVYDNLDVQLAVSNWSGNNTSNLKVKKNILFAKTISQLATKLYIASPKDIQYFGSYDSNCYVRPLRDDYVFNTTLFSPYQEQLYTLKSWQSASRNDINSSKSPIFLSDISNVHFEYNASRQIKIVYLGNDYYIDCRNKLYYSSLVLPPYTSVILMKISTDEKNQFLSTSFTNFKADQSTYGVMITFNTNNQSNQSVNTYTLEKSYDSIHYMTIAKFESKELSGSTDLHSLFDNDLSKGLRYYRLKLYNFNAESEFIKTIQILFKSTSPSFDAFPNPLTGQVINVRMNNLMKGDYSLQIVDITGQIVYRDNCHIGTNNCIQRIKLTKTLNTGIYNIILTNGYEKYTCKFVK